MGTEGEEKTELGEPIRQELADRWTKILTTGLGKDARDALIKKYPTPKNFPGAVAPILNPEVAASFSDTSLKRDKRIVFRQNMTGKVMTSLGRALTNIFKGDINTKSLIEQINDAAKMLAEIYHQDSSSRKFFTLPSTTKTIQEALKNTIPDEYLFGKDCMEKINTAQKIQKTSNQIRVAEKKTLSTANKKQGNWKSPLPQQQPRSGPLPQYPIKRQNPLRRLNQPHFNQPRQKFQRRSPPKSRPRYHK